jgi:subtilisin family serine protease
LDRVRRSIAPAFCIASRRGTSFAAPQVAALAVLLRNARPSASYSAVSNRIVSTRRLDIEQTMVSSGVPLAGLVDFNAATILTRQAS